MPELGVIPAHRKAHNSIIIAGDVRNKQGTEIILYAVSPGFIHGRAAGNVAAYFAVGKFPEANLRSFRENVHLIRLRCRVSGCTHKADRADYRVRVAAEASQHLAGMSGISRLPQNLPAEYYDGIGTDYEGIGVMLCHISGFHAGQVFGIRRGEAAFVGRLIHG